MADLTGTRLGPFEVTAVLGTGGFATVYRATDPRLKSEVAIKVLAENHALNPSVRERFLIEGQALRRVRSDALVGIHDIRETSDGRPYLVLEFAEGGSIVKRRRQLVGDGWTPGPADVLSVVRALTEALEALHAEELVHRDVSPANLLIRRRSGAGPPSPSLIVSEGEQLVLSDLGLVKDRTLGSGLTAGGGTVGYAAPEQRQPLSTIDHRADIYAASAVVLWLLTGDTPEEGGLWREQLDTAAWPSDFIDTLDRGMAAVPQDRPATIMAWSDAIVGAIEPMVEPSSDTGTDIVPVIDGAVADGFGRAWPKYLAGFGLGVAAMAVGWMAATGLTGPDADGDRDALESVSAVDGEVDTTAVQAALPTPVEASSESTAEADLDTTAQATPENDSETAAETDSKTTAETTARPETTTTTRPETTAETTPEATAATTTPTTVRTTPETTATTTVPTTPETTTMTTVPTTPETTTTTTSETTVTTSGGAVVPPPEITDLFWRESERVQLGVAWGRPVIPEGLIGTEIQISVDGGPWVDELDVESLKSAGWYIFTTGPDDDSTRVTPTRSYAARARWKLEDGSTTAWSEPFVLPAQS